MMKTHIKTEDTQFVYGPAGKLEAVLLEPIGVSRGAFGIVCHPHSLHGGNMQNKVVTTLARAFQHLGVTTVRFNFRGVGKSEGQFDHGNGEVDDLLAVIDWMQQGKAPHEIWLAGFSFGSFIAGKAATQVQDIKKLVMVAPPVLHFPMQELPPILCPWVLAQGELDDIVPAKDVFAWADQRDPKPTILRFPEAGHFFHGQLIELRTRIEEALG